MYKTPRKLSTAASQEPTSVRGGPQPSVFSLANTVETVRGMCGDDIDISNRAAGLAYRDMPDVDLDYTKMIDYEIAKRVYSWEDQYIERTYGQRCHTMHEAKRFIELIQAVEGDKSYLEFQDGDLGPCYLAPPSAGVGYGRIILNSTGFTSMTHWVMLHEYTHHRTRNRAGHGRDFVVELCRLVTRHMRGLPDIYDMLQSAHRAGILGDR